MSEAATPQEDLGDDAEHRSGPDIGRSSAIMASGTLFSRVLGFARNSLTAYVVGLTIIAADAWNAANTLPNIFHLLIAGGVLNAVIVPQITRAMRDADGGTTYINRLLTLSVTALAVITLLLMLAAPLLVSLVVSSSWPPEARTLATAFAVLIALQLRGGAVPALAVDAWLGAKLAVALVLGLPVALWFLVAGEGASVVHALVEYGQFISLLLALFVIASGITLLRPFADHSTASRV